MSYVESTLSVIYSNFALKDYEIVDSVSVDHSGHVIVLPRLLRDNLNPSTGINIIEVSPHDELR